jgi:hypothetical protein
VLIRRAGVMKPWPRDAQTPPYRLTYLELDSWEYWTMGAPVPETTVINRALPYASADRERSLLRQLDELARLSVRRCERHIGPVSVRLATHVPVIAQGERAGLTEDRVSCAYSSSGGAMRYTNGPRPPWLIANTSPVKLSCKPAFSSPPA